MPARDQPCPWVVAYHSPGRGLCGSTRHHLHRCRHACECSMSVERAEAASMAAAFCQRKGAGTSAMPQAASLLLSQVACTRFEAGQPKRLPSVQRHQYNVGSVWTSGQC